MLSPTAMILSTLLGGDPTAVAGDLRRYRGAYTFGHEVNAFCPAIRSRCYWVGPGTPAEVRAALRELATTPGGAPYTPVCVVLEGRIDRESARTGFAADYDGLIFVARVFGRCDETGVVTQGDLQHHRWLLQSIDGEPLDPDALQGTVPELDFGERMTVSGNSGCSRLTGRGVLREQYFFVEALASTLTSRTCTLRQVEIEATVLQVLGKDSLIGIDAEGRLTLDSEVAVLRFRLSDWVQ